MSQLRLLLTFSVAGFPLSESFLVSPRACTVGSEVCSRLSGSATSAVSKGQSSPPSRGSRTFHGRWKATLLAAEGRAGDDNNAGTPGGASNKPSRNKKRPRKHVSAAEEEGEREPVVGFEGIGGPFIGAAPTPTSPFAAPKVEERVRFERIMADVVGAEREEDLPGMLTKHFDFLLSVDVTVLTNDLIRQEPTMERVKTLHNAYDFIVTFLEGMVECTLEVQKENRNLLREIIEVAKIGPTEFDKKFETLQDRFTYEFVKYLDAEVDRLEKNGSKDDTGPGGGKELLNVMRIVRTRVCAQVDLIMGEDVAVLTRMLSYDDRYMMRAALRAVLGDKPPEAVDAFGKLVSMTLKDVTERGADVDPLLRYKLTDIADDIVVVARDAKERREMKAAEEAGG